MLILAVIPFVSLSFANPILFNSFSTSLVSRARPPDQLCDHPEEWDGRYCDEAQNAGAWFDRCVPDGEALYMREGQCPEGEQCFEHYDGTADNPGDEVINCANVPTTPDNKDVVSTKLQRGKRKFEADNTPNLERIVSVKLAEDIPEASVSAHVMG